MSDEESQVSGRYYALFLMTAMITVNFIDRQMMAVLSPAVQEDLKLTDWELGILKGIAFAVLYSLVSIPLARLADRQSRVKIVSAALIIWSGFTVISGLAQNFVQMGIARMGIAIGEAGGTAPAHSLLSDYFPKEKRAGALATMAIGIPLGASISFIAGGLISENYGWRIAFFAMGLPGILLALLIFFTVREPKRGQLEAKSHALPSAAPPLFKSIRTLLAIPTYRHVTIAMTLGSFSTYANANWLIDFFARVHPDFPRSDVFIALGGITAISLTLGILFGGFLVDRLARKSKAIYGWLPCIAQFLVFFPGFIMLWTDNPLLALIMQAPMQFALGMMFGPSAALIQTLAPVSVRALASAAHTFAINLLALGLGPTLVGVVSSLLIAEHGNAQSLRIALTLTSCTSLVAAFFFFRVSQSILRDWQEATKEKKGVS